MLCLPHHFAMRLKWDNVDEILKSYIRHQGSLFIDKDILGIPFVKPVWAVRWWEVPSTVRWERWTGVLTSLALTLCLWPKHVPFLIPCFIFKIRAWPRFVALSVATRPAASTPFDCFLEIQMSSTFPGLVRQKFGSWHPAICSFSKSASGESAACWSLRTLKCLWLWNEMLEYVSCRFQLGNASVCHLERLLSPRLRKVRLNVLHG